MNKSLIFLIVLVFLSSFVCAESINSNSLDYVDNFYEDMFIAGSKICYDSMDNHICAPIISFNLENKIFSSSITINLTNNISISGTACLLENNVEDKWITIMSELSNKCVSFSSNTNQIIFNFPHELSDYSRIVLIPESGLGEADLFSAKLESIQIEIPPEIPKNETENNSYSSVTRCYVNSINIESSDLFAKFPILLNIDFSDCLNSEVLFYIKRMDIIPQVIVSQSQYLISSDSKQINWIPEYPGEYMIFIESENSLNSESIMIKESDINEISDDKPFYKLIDDIHTIAEYDPNIAIGHCSEFKTNLQKDACYQDLAMYLNDKSLCAKIHSSEKQSSCYYVFALNGDVSSCLNAAGNRLMCLMLSGFSEASDITLNPYSNITKSEVISKKVDSKSNLWKIIFYIIILIVIIFLYKFMISKLSNKKFKKIRN